MGLAFGAVLLSTGAARAGEPLGPEDPLAGFSGDTAYLRSADNRFVLLPSGRLQVDGYFFKRPTDGLPQDAILLRRARLELGGWVGTIFGFQIGGDFAAGTPAGADPIAQSSLNATDDYVLVAPWADLAILQIGQFDAPFSLENRTSDKYFDFMERSVTVRAFAVPTNKEVGGMVHGLLPDKMAYYSLGLFDGEGQNFRNADSDFDFVGRAWVAPGAMAGQKDFEEITLGGSWWLGSRGGRGLALANQTTQGGFKFFDNAGFAGPVVAPATAGPKGALHQRGDLHMFAFELDAPILHKAGVRFEYVHKNQQLVEADITNTASGAILPALGNAELDGYSMYGEAWYWILGDDTIIGRPGLQLPGRLKKRPTLEPQPGLMVAARLEYLNEEITAGNATTPNPNANPSVGKTKLTSFELGVNYWYSRRYRATFNYVLNHFGGDSAYQLDAAKGPAAINQGKDEHEFLLRAAIAL